MPQNPAKLLLKKDVLNHQNVYLLSKYCIKNVILRSQEMIYFSLITVLKLEFDCQLEIMVIALLIKLLLYVFIAKIKMLDMKFEHNLK